MLLLQRIATRGRSRSLIASSLLSKICCDSRTVARSVAPTGLNGCLFATHTSGFATLASVWATFWSRLRRFEHRYLVIIAGKSIGSIGISFIVCRKKIGSIGISFSDRETWAVAILNCESLLSKIAVIVEQLQEVSPLRGSMVVCLLPTLPASLRSPQCGLPSGRAYGALSIGISFTDRRKRGRSRSFIVSRSFERLL